MTTPDLQPPATMATEEVSAPASAWSPLRYPTFRALWLASLVSALGTWMQNVGGSWLITDLSASPLIVSLMQTASALPILLLAVPGGALADVVDRRRLLLVTQTWMLLVSLALAVLTLAGVMSAPLLLGLTFALGIGAALNNPAWQTIPSETVPRAELLGAVALSGAAVNGARAIGPALAGLILVQFGAGWVFTINTITFVAVLWALWNWKREPALKSTVPPQGLSAAMLSGLRYARHAPDLQAPIVRAGMFAFGASALWGLLPLVARRDLLMSATGFGLMQAALGAGAVTGTFLMPTIRQKLSPNAIIAASTLLFVVATLCLGWVRSPGWLGTALFAGGIGWLAVLSTFNVAVQTGVPRWVQARALGLYLMVLMGGMGLSSLVWGQLAAQSNHSIALSVAAACLVLGLAAGIRFPIRASGGDAGLAPALSWPEPAILISTQEERGPVLVQIEYCIAAPVAGEFIEAMSAWRQARERNGAERWNLWQDAIRRERFVEEFTSPSWEEHSRFHERLTQSDVALQERLQALQSDGAPLQVSHLVVAGALEIRP